MSQFILLNGRLPGELLQGFSLIDSGSVHFQNYLVRAVHELFPNVSRDGVYLLVGQEKNVSEEVVTDAQNNLLCGQSFSETRLGKILDSILKNNFSMAFFFGSWEELPIFIDGKLFKDHIAKQLPTGWPEVNGLYRAPTQDAV